MAPVTFCPHPHSLHRARFSPPTLTFIFLSTGSSCLWLCLGCCPFSIRISSKSSFWKLLLDPALQIPLTLLYSFSVAPNIWFPDHSVVKNLPAMQETGGSIPGSGGFPGEGNGSPLQYSYLENPMNRGSWWAIVMRSQSWTWLRH